MRIGGSLLLIALGAILRFAITTKVNGVDLHVIGVILMIVGVVALVITVVFMSTRRRTDVYQHTNGTTYVTPRPPSDQV
ncbi:MAG: DUF6458 family protein [Actinomycetota bacterium]|nr:DUF6458 family protein [Actinomycetota bacterium]